MESRQQIKFELLRLLLQIYKYSRLRKHCDEAIGSIRANIPEVVPPHGRPALVSRHLLEPEKGFISFRAATALSARRDPAT